MNLGDFSGFVILGRKHDGTVEQFQITQSQAQTWLDRAGFFRPVILAGFSQLGAYRVPGEGAIGSEGIGGSDQAGDSRPQETTPSGEGTGETLASIAFHYATRTDDNA